MHYQEPVKHVTQLVKPVELVQILIVSLARQSLSYSLSIRQFHQETV